MLAAMIRALLLPLAATTAAVAAFALPAGAAPPAAGERSFTVTDFDRVVIEAPVAVRLTTGRPSSARAIGSARAAEAVSVTVEGGTLRVRPNRSAWGGYPGERAGTVELELSTRSLRSANVAGAGSLDIDRAEGLRVQLGVNGSGRLRVRELAADNLSLALVGAGRLELAGTARQLRGDFHGSGEVDASALRADDATIVTDTAGAVALHVVRAATVTAAGLGPVRIAGTSNCTLRGPNAAAVRCGGSDQGQPRQTLRQ
jgi:hypothetical protein